MIDQSAKPFEENVRVTREVVEYAHARGVSVEAELGKIGTTDFVETDEDEEHFTDPDEAGEFVRRPGSTRSRSRSARRTATTPRASPGSISPPSGDPGAHRRASGAAWRLGRAARDDPGRGAAARRRISKVNIATDLEHAMLTALGRTQRMTDQECRDLPPPQMRLAQDAVERLVTEKIESFLGSADRAAAFEPAVQGGLDAA
jgi:fructose-bisphosphate aldolase class II